MTFIRSRFVYFHSSCRMRLFYSQYANIFTLASKSTKSHDSVLNKMYTCTYNRRKIQSSTGYHPDLDLDVGSDGRHKGRGGLSSQLLPSHCSPLFKRQGKPRLLDLDLGILKNYDASPFIQHIRFVSGPVKQRSRLEWYDRFRSIVESKGGSESDWLPSDWESVVETLSISNGPSWEVMCMNALYKDKCINLGRSLMNYLEEKGEPISHIVMTFFIGLLGETSTSFDQDEETKAYFDRLMATQDILDAASIEVLSSGLSCTKYYRECITLAKMYEETSKLGPPILLHMLTASVRFQDMELCHSTIASIEENIEVTHLISSASKLIEACLSVNNEEGLVAVMDLFQKHNLLIPQSQTEEIINSFHRYQPNKWHIETSNIHHWSGRCRHCRYQMERTVVTDAEFAALQRNFLDQVIVSSNIFYKTTPEEVDSFIKFLDKAGPFDVVIDGLNVLHKQTPPKKPDVVGKAVRHFLDQDKKVLLLGSKILARSITDLRMLKPRLAVYLTSTTKADDSFFLYAALSSGKDTLIVSKDKLRDHKFLMGPQLAHIFQRWLRGAQIYDWFFRSTGEFTLGRQNLFNIGPHRDEHGWHIPVNDISKEFPYGNFQVLCIRDAPVARLPSESNPKPRETMPKDKVRSERKQRANSNRRGDQGKHNSREHNRVDLNLDDVFKI